MKRGRISAWLAASSVFAIAEAAHAQQQAGASSQATVEEVVVTALKRNLSVQSTPATINVVSANQLAEANIATMEQLGSIAPGIIVQRPPNNTANATVRGLGTSPGPVTFDQGVAMFVDGVYAARGADFLSSIFDLERIEVVKGTQAAVLGKNTSLGAIVLTTRKPGDVFGADATASYEFENSSTQISGGVDIPANPDLAIRLAGQFQDLGGFVENRVVRPPAERRARQTDERAGRITAVWTPTDKLDVTVSYAHEHLRNTGLPYEVIRSSPAMASLFALSGFPQTLEPNLDLHNATWSSKGPTRLWQKSDRATGTINYSTGIGTVTSVTGWSRFDQKRVTDNDLTPGDYYDDNAAVEGDQFSQELRLSSDSDSAFQYLVGALYLRNKLYQDLAQDTHYPSGMNGAFRAFLTQKTDTWSLFAQPQYEFGGGFTLIGGIRVTGEEKRVDMRRLAVRPGLFTALLYPPYPLTHLSRSETVLDGSVTVQYRRTDNLMVYASWGQGSKGGGYTDFATPANAEYEKEVAQSVELGFKLEGDDRSWRLNSALFHTVVDGFQNNTFNGTNFIVENLDISSTGVELDAAISPAPGLNFSLAGTYARTRNKDHAPGLGDRMPRSPRLAGKIAVDYETGLSDDLSIHFAADLTYRSKISHQINPDAVPFGKAFPTWNAVIGLSSDALGVDISLIGRNLTDSRSTSFGFPAAFAPGAIMASPEEGRTVALQVRFKR